MHKRFRVSTLPVRSTDEPWMASKRVETSARASRVPVNSAPRA